MIGYFLYGLTFIAYILLIPSDLKTSHSGGSDAAYGAAMGDLVVWAILAAFILCSLLLSITIAIQGGFNWISATATIRNIGIAVIWMGIMAGVAHCTTGRVDYTKDYELTATARLLSQVIYYGAIWLPLFMLVPYFLLLNPEWRDTLSPNLFKIPLFLASVLGVLLFMSPKIMKKNALKSYRKLDRREWAFNDAMKRMEKNPSVGNLLYYTTKDTDKQVRSAALAKIKALLHESAGGAGFPQPN